jgi:HemK-like putative methylase
VTNDTDALQDDIARRLEAADVPLRSGEQPAWQQEARLLVERASTEDPTRSLDQLLDNRLNGIPLAYLVGTEVFLGDEFQVETGVVIPHPATELLAMLTFAAIDKQAQTTDKVKLMEIGVGVGVVAVSALKRRPGIEAHCSELSGAALRLTRENAQHILGSTKDLYLYQAFLTDDIFSPFKARPGIGASVLVSNPPYLVEGDEVSDATKKSGIAHFSYAPENDPSWFLRRIVEAPEGMLNDNCSVLMECADWYLPDHVEVMQEAGWGIEVFDREAYLERFGSSPELREMTPTAHRVLHAWHGADARFGGGLEEFEQ